ncbi:MAG: hypothetical protein WCF57_07470 [Pyrinomonadaceae bacterium]
MVKTKPEERSGMRQPGAKKKLGLAVPPALRLPHDDLIHAVIPSSEEGTSMPSQTRQPSQTTPTSQTRRTSQTRQSQPSSPPTPVAPERDFTRTANSIVREAVPAGVFKGKSKQIYDCLYSLTRGAIVPKRKVRISRPKLMALAHIGSRATFDSNVRHLSAVGLVVVEQITGEHEGNEYQVFLPEEMSMPSQTSQSSLTSPAQKLVRLDSLETSQTRQSISSEESTTYDPSKTSFKTNTEHDDDDAALAGLYAMLKEAAKEVTGKGLSPAEHERWRELGEVLATELRIAATRTTVSSAPSFLTEHLRRRLWKKDKGQLQSEAAASSAVKPKYTLSVEQISKCPDCGGSGFYYPQGYEGGVAKCRHEKLATSSNPEQISLEQA